MVAQTKLGRTNFPTDVSLERIAEDTYRARNDIAAFAGIATGEAHRIVESGILGVAGLSQALKEMEAYESISGFSDEDLPLFRKRLGSLAAMASTKKREQDFQRVLELSGLPEYGPESGALSIPKLLDGWDSSEAREFRDWLASCGDAEEAEIRDRVAGLRARAGLKVGSRAGKTLRFLASRIRSSGSSRDRLISFWWTESYRVQALQRSSMSSTPRFSKGREAQDKPAELIDLGPKMLPAERYVFPSFVEPEAAGRIGRHLQRYRALHLLV